MSSFDKKQRDDPSILEWINKAKNEAVRQGVDPNVLILGPYEFSQFEKYILDLPWGTSWRKANLGPEGESMEFQGMKVERSDLPGVRVGWVSEPF